MDVNATVIDLYHGSCHMISEYVFRPELATQLYNKYICETKVWFNFVMQLLVRCLLLTCDSAPSFQSVKFLKCKYLICDQTKKLMCKISLSRDLASSYYLGIAKLQLYLATQLYIAICEAMQLLCSYLTCGNSIRDKSILLFIFTYFSFW